MSIDNLTELPQSLFLVPMVKAAQEAIQALEQAEVILLGPGSFVTSIMPPLLLPELATALRNSKAKVIFIDNLGVEIGAASQLSLGDCIQKIHEIVGEPIIDGSLHLIVKKVRSICLLSSVKNLGSTLMRMMSAIVMTERYLPKLSMN